MRRIAKKLSASLLVAGALVAVAPTHTAGAAATLPTGPGITAPSQPVTPIMQPLDCNGGTGFRGCGPGWIWHDGWRGFACYVC
jgi:hypothetical protein